MAKTESGLRDKVAALQAKLDEANTRCDEAMRSKMRASCGMAQSYRALYAAQKEMAVADMACYKATKAYNEICDQLEMIENNGYMELAKACSAAKS